MSVEALVWLILLVLFLLVEASTVGLVSIWFAAGALLALLSALFGLPLIVQIIVFFVFSGVCLLLMRPLVRKYLRPRISPTNVDAVIGKEGIVTKQINNLTAEGTVRINSMDWSARSAAGETIAPGTRVRVERIEGVKVFVSLSETPAEVPQSK